MTDVTPEQFTQLLDGNIDQQPNPEGYTALLNPAPTRGPNTNARYVGQSALIQGSPYEREILEMASAQPDTKEYKRQKSDEWYQDQMQQVQTRIQEALLASPDVINRVIADSQEQVNQLQQDMHSPVATEKAYTAQAAVNGVSDVTDQKANILAMANDLHEAYEAQSVGETILDFGSYFIPFKETLDIEDIDDQINANPQLADIAGENLESIVGAWKALPVDRQAQLFPHLKEAVLQATSTLGITDGNLLKTVNILTNFFAVEGAGELRQQQIEDIAFSLPDVPAASAVKALNGIRALSKTQKVAAAQVLKEATETAASSTSAVRVASDADDVASAAAHTAAAALDEQTATALGTTRVDAAMSAMPLETNQWFKTVTDDPNLPGAVADKMNDIAAKASGFARKLTDETELMQLGVLNGSERQQVMTNFFERMDKVGEDYLTEHLEMDNLRVTSEDATGFSYTYTLKDKNNPTTPGGKEKLTLRTGEVKFKVNDVTGNYSATVNDSIAQSASNVVSPTAWSVRTDAGDFNLEVKRALQSDDLAAAYTAKSGELLDWAIEPVRGALDFKARGRIERVLEAGDEFINPETQVHGRVFTPSELVAGIETKSGTVRLTSPKEQEAYYRFRMYADATFQAENYVLRRELELGGFKDVKLFSLSTPAGDSATVKNVRTANRAVGRPFDSVNAALSSVRGRNGQGIWDDNLGKTVDISEDYIRRAYDEGDVVVRFKQDWNTKGTGDLDSSGEMVQYARVKKDRVADLPASVLNYKAGYVPKINEARFVVSQAMPMIARNRPNLLRTQAMRAFDSLSDAQAFREELITKYVNKHDVGRDAAERLFPEVGLVEDLPLSSRLEEAVGAHTGLYHGTRSKDELLFGLSGQEMSRISPFEAFQRHTKHLGSFVSQNEVRVARERRWLNTVRAEFPEVEIRGFEDTLLPTGKAKTRAAEAVRNQIREWNGIPTQQEQFFNSQWQRIHDWSLNVGRDRFGLKDKESVKSIQWLMHVNPWSAMKSAVMHNLLGFFNPAQLYTQASSLLIAMTKHPMEGPKMLAAAPVFGLLDNVRNAKALKGVYKNLKSGGLIDDELVDAYDAWLRTGLREAVYNNSDIARVAGTGFGLTNKLLRDFDFLSLYLYRSGELTARRATFAAEYLNWRRRTGKRVPNNDELSEILEESHKDMLELGPANKAYWQGGEGTGTFRQMLGVATQFMQVGTKTMELIFKNERRGGFSSREKTRIMMGQMALFGAAGVPLGGVIAQWLAKGFGVEEMDQTTADGLNQGFVGMTYNLLLGAESEVSERFALGAQITQMVEDFITSEDPLWLKAFGPAGGGVFGRTWDAFGELKLLAQVDWSGHQEIAPEIALLGASALAQIPSTGRNWWKYHLMTNYNAILDRRRNVIVNQDFDEITEVGALLGFQPSAEVDARMLFLDNRGMDEMVRSYADARVSLLHRAVYEMKLDPNAILAIQAALQMVDETTPEWVKIEGQKQFIDRVFGERDKTRQERELEKFIRRTAVDKIREDALLDSTDPLGTASKPFTQPFKQLLDGPQGGSDE